MRVFFMKREAPRDLIKLCLLVIKNKDYQFDSDDVGDLALYNNKLELKICDSKIVFKSRTYKTKYFMKHLNKMVAETKQKTIKQMYQTYKDLNK